MNRSSRVRAEAAGERVDGTVKAGHHVHRRSRIDPGAGVVLDRGLLALNACIWHNWLIGAPVKRSLIAYDHT